MGSGPYELSPRTGSLRPDLVAPWCGRLTNSSSPSAIGKQFNVPEASLFEARYSIAPTQTVAVGRHTLADRVRRQRTLNHHRQSMGIRRRGKCAVPRWRWIHWAVLIVEWRRREVGGGSACVRRGGSGFRHAARDRRTRATHRAALRTAAKRGVVFWPFRAPLRRLRVAAKQVCRTLAASCAMPAKACPYGVPPGSDSKPSFTSAWRMTTTAGRFMPRARMVARPVAVRPTKRQAWVQWKWSDQRSCRGWNKGTN
jgi:hypothetical protein